MRPAEVYRGVVRVAMILNEHSRLTRRTVLSDQVDRAFRLADHVHVYWIAHREAHALSFSL
jgi:hypothetical protein